MKSGSWWDISNRSLDSNHTLQQRLQKYIVTPFVWLSEDQPYIHFMVFFPQPSKAQGRKMLNFYDLPLIEISFSGFFVLLFDKRPWEVFRHKKNFFWQVTDLRKLLWKKLLLGRVCNTNCCLRRKTNFYLWLEKKSCSGSCLCLSCFSSPLLFSFNSRFYLISGGVNISDRILGGLTNRGGWEKNGQ